MDHCQNQRIMAHDMCLQLSSQVSDPSRFAEARKFHWKEGDIAFLKSQEEFEDLDWQCLIGTGYLPPRATGHPVIILKHRSDDSTHVAITTVSSYSSRKHKSNLAPWKRACNSDKNKHHFRSFLGSESSNKSHVSLELQSGKMMPKRETSWVYIQNIYVVPITTLKIFDKPRTRLRMTNESLYDLCSHMMAETEDIDRVFEDPRLADTISNKSSKSMASILPSVSSAYSPPTEYPQLSSYMYIPPPSERYVCHTGFNYPGTSYSLSHAYLSPTELSQVSSYMIITPPSELPAEPCVYDFGI